MPPKRKRPPTIPDDAELVLKESFLINSEDHPIPDIILLGNRSGFRYLSRLFAFMADREVYEALAGGCDPDDHRHLETVQPPFNAKLSDALEFRLGNLTATNRRATFKKYNITRKSRQAGGIVERYAKLTESAKRYLKKFR